ncbi:MAG: efflux RND transporter periplasmic adaptor subunit [Anaerolineales bacterium]|nr:efflux RND transporter periplasmic adaptor subunit [Anaerolineales bacterium]
MKKLVTFLLLSLLLVSCRPADSAALQASGLIEATEVAISPEIGGQVAEVFVREGDSVKAGDPILRIEDELLTAQRQAAAASVATAKSAYQAAEAAYASAQTQYEIALVAARAADSSNRTQDWVGKRPDPFNQPKWYFTREETVLAAQAVIETAQNNLDAAQADLDQVIQDLNNADFLETEKRLADARITYLVTKGVYERAKLSKETITPDELAYPDIPLNFQGSYQDRIAIAKDLSEDPNLVRAAQRAYDAAKAELQAAQIAYSDLLASDAATRVLDARAEFEVAKEQLESAHDYLASLQTGEDSLSVTAANDAVEQAKAGMDQAQATVTESEAQLAVLDLQINKLTINAPMDGVVLTRSVQPGEVVQAGMTVITIAKLDTLKITVYIPEDRYGEVKLGDSASLSVDSFPSETFSATVTRIADQAEYTPRNVQTKEERQTTVYAVELSVKNPDGKLKPGMPVDVTFGQ